MVVIEMENGKKIKIELYPEIAPITCANFEKLVKEGFYDGLIFHRVISGFMIQGGDPEGTGMGGAKENIKGEFAQNGVKNDLKHTRGVISMARSMMPDSASSQFFIMHKDAPHLDGGYAAFGKVVDGMDAEDCEECVNDTLMKAWNAIPPQKPKKLSAFLGRITRNLSLNRFFEKTADKRGSGQTAAVLDELAECVSSGVTTEDISDNNTLRHALNDFLFCLEPEKRIIFMQRYWYMMPIKAIAAEHSSTESRIKMILLRTRSELKEHHIKEGITL